jgi:hypothetical protein
MPTTSATSKTNADRIIIIEDQVVVQKIDAGLVDATQSPRYPVMQSITAWRRRICEADSIDGLL